MHHPPPMHRHSTLLTLHRTKVNNDLDLNTCSTKAPAWPIAKKILNELSPNILNAQANTNNTMES
jgi:hypothetical protein